MNRVHAECRWREASSGSEDELAIARRGSGGDARLVEGYLNFLACGGCTDADGLAGEKNPVDAPGGVRV